MEYVSRMGGVNIVTHTLAILTLVITHVRVGHAGELLSFTKENYPDPRVQFQACNRPGPSWVCDPGRYLTTQEADVIERRINVIPSLGSANAMVVAIIPRLQLQDGSTTTSIFDLQGFSVQQFAKIGSRYGGNIMLIVYHVEINMVSANYRANGVTPFCLCQTIYETRQHQASGDLVTVLDIFTEKYTGVLSGTRSCPTPSSNVPFMVNSIGQCTWTNSSQITISSLEPRSGPPEGGTEVVITGQNLNVTSGNVLIGTLNCQLISRTATMVTCRTSALQNQLNLNVPMPVYLLLVGQVQYDTGRRFVYTNGTPLDPQASSTTISQAQPTPLGPQSSSTTVSQAQATPLGPQSSSTTISQAQATPLGPQSSNTTDSQAQATPLGPQSRSTTVSQAQATSLDPQSSNTTDGQAQATSLDPQSRSTTVSQAQATSLDPQSRNITVRQAPPVLIDVQPRTTTVSGGLQLTVEGTNLDQVITANMTTLLRGTRTGKEILSTTECQVRNSTAMLCPTPPLDIKGVRSQVSRRHVRGHRAARQAGDDDDDDASTPVNDIEMSVTFIVNGENSPLQNGQPAPVTPYEDPVLYPFKGEERTSTFISVWPKSERMVEIVGTGLLPALKDHTLIVEVGVGNCTAQVMASNLLICYPPIREPEKKPSAGPHPAVVANVGSLQFDVGQLQYWDTLWKYPDARYTLVGVIPGILLASIIVVCCCVCCYLKKKPNPYGK